jgi:hypothetical protein
MNEIYSLIGSAIGSGLVMVGLVRPFLRDFKADNEARMDKMDKRMNQFEEDTRTIEDRMFLVLTGKNLADVIREERMKLEEKK